MIPAKSYSKNIWRTLYKNALTRSQGVGIIYSILAFIFYPMFYCLHVFSYIADYKAGRGGETLVFDLMGKGQLYPFVTVFLFFILIIGMAIIVPAMCNRYMHSKQAVDVYHALPVKRSQLLWANFAASCTIILAPLAVSYGVVALVNCFTVKESLWLILQQFAIVAILATAIIVVTIFCSVCCNAVIDTVIFSLALNLIIPAYVFVIAITFKNYLVGFSVTNDIFKSIQFSPAILMYEPFFYRTISISAWIYVFYVALIIGGMFLSVFLYTSRKSELAESGKSNRFIYQVLMILGSIGFGILSGYITSAFFIYTFYETVSIYTIIFSGVFSVIGYYCINSLMSRSVKIDKTGIIGLGCTLLITITFLISVNTGWFGYVTYVPRQENIRSVKIEYVGSYEDIAYLIEEEQRTYLSYNGRSLGVTLTEEKDIQLIQQVHRGITDNLKTTGQESRYLTFAVEYTLNSGRKVTRSYNGISVPVTVINKLSEIENQETFKKQLSPFHRGNYTQVDFVEIKDGYGNNYQKLSLSEAQLKILYEAVAKDELNITTQIREQELGTVYAKLGFRYKIGYTNNNRGYPYQLPYFENVNVNVTPAMIHTIKALESLGLESYTKTPSVEKLKGYVAVNPYYAFNSDYADLWVNTNRFAQADYREVLLDKFADNFVEITETAQLQEVAKSCTQHLNVIKNPTEYIVAIFVPEDFDMEKDNWEKDVVGMTYYIPYNKVPTFLQEQGVTVNTQQKSTHTSGDYYRY